jgi:outer membrane protein assembly factor BamD
MRTSYWENGRDLSENAAVNIGVLHELAHRRPGSPVRWAHVFSATSLLLLLNGCATNGTPAPDEHAAYAAFSEAVERGDCARADAALETLHREVSGDPLLASARLQTADICIRADEPQRARRQTAALVSGDASFTQRDYVQYLHAVAGYGIWKQNHRAASARPELLADVAMAREAVEDFAVLVREFPDSRHREEVLWYLVDLHEGLARSELAVAQLDLDRGEYQRAAARAGYVMEHFGETASVSDARALQQRALALAASPPEGSRAADAGLIVSEPVRIDPDPPPIAARPTVASTPATTAMVPAPLQAPQPARASVAQPGAAAGGAEWIRSQPRTAFTIQVLGLAREAGVRDFLAQHPLDRETAWFRTERNGADWFVAVAGSYPNAEAARRSIDSLPPEVLRHQPWIRSFGSVQDAIR